MKPRFDEPEYTADAEVMFVDDAPPIDEGGPLPSFVEPDSVPVLSASTEPLVRVEHRKIRALANYWHAGWSDAIPSTWIRADVLDRMARVADSLPEQWGLAVFDAWRPFALQKELYETADADPRIESGFMAPPSSDPTRPPPHLTGGAVDLTLTFVGTPIAAGSKFDDTTTLAHAAHFEDEPGPARHIRRALYHAMAGAGFVVYSGEWWHFEYGTGRWAAITGNDPIYGSAAPHHGK